MNHSRVIPAAVIVLGAAGAGVGLSACGPVASPPRASIVITVPAARASSPAAAATPAAPAAAPSSPVAQAPPAAPEVTDPWAVVSAYYGDIESGNYAEAWSLLSPSMQASLGPYSGWAAGYQTTLSTSVSEITEAGDAVTVSITAEQSDGSYRSYSGYYTVDGGKVTSAHITQD